MLRLSFIVPFYNVGPYIEECIRSLYNQDIPQSEYEVICVDDCSPDGSRTIVERLQKEYPTLKLLIHTENKRQGGARNTGMREAKGKYIWFVDSDDYIMPNCLKGLIELAEEEELDILDFDFDADYSKQQFRKNIESYEMGPCTGADYVFSQRQGRWSWRCCCVWGGLVKYDLIRDMQFRENVQYEDNDYALKMYAKANKMKHIPKKPYYYRVVAASTVHKSMNLTQICYLVELVKAYIEIYEEKNGNDDIRWSNGIKELIKYTTDQVLRNLIELDLLEMRQFYKMGMGHICGIGKFVTKKTWLKLHSYFALKLFI